MSVVNLFPQPAAPASRVIDVFLRYLKAEGVRVIFGIPGGLLHPLFEAVEDDDDMRLVVSKHEEGAAFMADGFALASVACSRCARGPRAPARRT